MVVQKKAAVPNAKVFYMYDGVKVTSRVYKIAAKINKIKLGVKKKEKKLLRHDRSSACPENTVWTTRQSSSPSFPSSPSLCERETRPP